MCYFPRLRFFGVPCPCGLLGVTPALQGPHFGCVALRPLRRQQALLVARALLGPGAVSAAIMTFSAHLCVPISLSLYRDPRCAWRCRRLVSAQNVLSMPGCGGPIGVPGGWGVSIYYLTLSFCPQHSVTLEGHSGGFVTPGQLFHSRSVDTLRRLDSPSHSLTNPPQGFLPLQIPPPPHMCFPPRRA